MTTKEMVQKTGLSRQRLYQLRNGKKVAPNSDGKIYQLKPKLIEGEDWFWERGQIIYRESALKKLTKKGG